jgi:glycosyltransferase involved in cell wall biosynthesis
MTTNPHPLVSVIVPVYNHEHYVKQALNSILHQTYPNIEIIIIDDGSKDSSTSEIEKVLIEWEKNGNISRNIQFLKQENQGAHYTINKGLSLAKGEWLTILNSDDYYHLERIEKLIKQTAEGNNQLAFSYVVGVNEKNEPVGGNHFWWRWYELVRKMLFFKPTVGFLLLEENLAVSTGNLFFSRKLYQEVGSFKDLKLAHDLDFLLRALPLTEPALIRENLYFYRIHETNTIHTVAHLRDQEIRDMRINYLCHVFASPPKNLQAPCHWYWPSEFAKWRTKHELDKYLDVFIEKKPTEKELLPSLETKENLPINNSTGIPITLVSHELSLTGAPKLVVDLATSLIKKGYSPNIISLGGGPMEKELEKLGIPVHTILTKTKFLKFASLLYAICFKVKGQVIANSISSWPVLIPLTLMRPWSKPIWYIHESVPSLGISGGRRRFLSLPLIYLCQKFTPPKIWFGSTATQKSWEYSPFSKSKVFYWSGILKNTTNKKPQLALKNLLSVGTASCRKGTQALVSAFLHCLENQLIPDDVTLRIIGFPGSNSPDFLQLSDTILKVVTSKYKDRIQMISHVQPESLDAFYEQSDLYIQASVMECMPLALLKAMSVGLPIITTDADGCAEAITNEESGYICLPYNIQSLANAIAKAVNHVDESIKMGRKAQTCFNERFSLEATEELVLKELQK